MGSDLGGGEEWLSPRTGRYIEKALSNCQPQRLSAEFSGVQPQDPGLIPLERLSSGDTAPAQLPAVAEGGFKWRSGHRPLRCALHLQSGGESDQHA